MFGVMHHNNVPDDRHIKVRMLISIRPWAVHGTIGWMDAIPGRPLLPPLEEMDRAAPLIPIALSSDFVVMSGVG